MRRNSRRADYGHRTVVSLIFDQFDVCQGRSQLPEGVLAELERLNLKNARGNRHRKHHQHLTESTGNVHLDRQINTVITLMKISRNRPAEVPFASRSRRAPSRRSARKSWSVRAPSVSRRAG